MRLKSEKAWAIIKEAEQSKHPEKSLNTLLTTHNRREVRTRTAHKLGSRSKVTDIEPLLKALNDKSTMVQQSAAIACGRLRIQEAVPVLCEKLKGLPGYHLEISILKAFTLLQDKRAIKPILDYASQIKSYPYLTMNAAKALGWILLAQRNVKTSKWQA